MPPSTGKWLQDIIDELDEAIDNGWCNCEPEIPCCIPTGNGTFQYDESHGGYSVTCPYWQIVEQYLYGNIDYTTAEAAFPDGVLGTDRGVLTQAAAASFRTAIITTIG